MLPVPVGAGSKRWLRGDGCIYQTKSYKTR